MGLVPDSSDLSFGRERRNEATFVSWGRFCYGGGSSDGLAESRSKSLWVSRGLEIDWCCFRVDRKFGSKIGFI